MCKSFGYYTMRMTFIALSFFRLTSFRPVPTFSSCINFYLDSTYVITRSICLSVQLIEITLNNPVPSTFLHYHTCRWLHFRCVICHIFFMTPSAGGPLGWYVSWLREWGSGKHRSPTDIFQLSYISILMICISHALYYLKFEGMLCFCYLALDALV